MDELVLSEAKKSRAGLYAVGDAARGTGGQQSDHDAIGIGNIEMAYRSRGASDSRTHRKGTEQIL